MKNRVENLKRIAAIASLDAMVDGVLTIVLPLYLIVLNIEMVEIGLIFAVMQIIFLFARILLAIVGDSIGARKILTIEGLFSLLMNMTYYFAVSPLFFVFGKIFEGMKNSAFWAVIRTATFKASKEGEEGRSAAVMVSLRSFAYSAGRLMAGFLLVYLSFKNTFLVLAGVGLVIALLALTMPNGDKKGKLSPNGMKRLLEGRKWWKSWKVSVPLAACDVVATILFSFVLPIYMKTQLNMGYEAIGFWLAIFFLLEALSNFIVTKLKVSYQLLGQRSVIFGVIPITMMWYPPLFVPMLLLYGLGSGFSSAMYEEVVARATKKKNNVSTTIALLMIPTRIGNFIALIVVGALVQIVGYPPVFVLAALGLLAFALLTMKRLKEW